jgi:hypothetical protein
MRVPLTEELVLDGRVNFWTLLALALGALWLQANAIACAALSALRAEARVRWEALMMLERQRFELRTEEERRKSETLQRWGALLEGSLQPELASEVEVFFEARRLVEALGPVGGGEVMALRCREALRHYALASVRYNASLPMRWGWPLSRWMGFAPCIPPLAEAHRESMVYGFGAPHHGP